MPKSSHVAINDKGRRIGESHPRARLTDHEVDLLREFVEDRIEKDGLRPMAAYREAAEKFETTPRYAQKIALCLRRGHAIAGHRKVGTG